MVMLSLTIAATLVASAAAAVPPKMDLGKMFQDPTSFGPTLTGGRHKIYEPPAKDLLAAESEADLLEEDGGDLFTGALPLPCEELAEDNARLAQRIVTLERSSAEQDSMLAQLGGLVRQLRRLREQQDCAAGSCPAAAT
mmetsp:Transcript_117915/g.334362  ORF Transcript_117915/g.334362 Transcript_117915/m.334362 type:complete len:139 (-) Transcript_117915:318-734(-)